MRKLLLGLLLTLCTTNLIVGQKSSFIHPDFKSITESHKVIAVVPGKETRSRNPKALGGIEAKSRPKGCYSWHSDSTPPPGRVFGALKLSSE